MILLLGIFLSVVFIGFQVYKGYRDRKVYFDSLCRFCDNLITEIGFSKKTIAQIIESYSYCRNFNIDLQHFKERKILLWQNLKEIEKVVIAEFLQNLGKHAVSEEIEKITNAKERFEMFRASAMEKLKTEASIYLKISILLGIGIVILLI